MRSSVFAVWIVALAGITILLPFWLLKMVLSPLFAVFFVLGVAFLACFKLVPFVIYRMQLKQIVGKDMNKQSQPVVPEMGGTAILFGFSFAVLFSILLDSFASSFIQLDLKLDILFAGLSTILLIGFLGVFDDLIGWKNGIRQYQHALLPLFAALPLVAVRAGVTHMQVPLLGTVDFGIWYALVLIPIGVTGAANAMNMLAGLNGLEAGLGSVITGTLLILAVLEQQWEAAIIMAAMLGALLAFLRFNWFPAKIFPGDATTLMVGAAVAVASILGNMERIGVFLLVLFVIELLLKARYQFQTESFGVPQPDGTLRSPSKISSLTHWIMAKGKFTEDQIVIRIIALQVVVSVLVLLYWYLNSVQFFAGLIG